MECVTCVCVWLRAGCVGGSGLGLGFTNPGGTGGKWDICLCFGCRGVGGVGGGVGGRLGPGMGGGGGGVKSMFVVSAFFCVDGRSRYLYIVLGGYLRILGAHSVQSSCIDICFLTYICL